MINLVADTKSPAPPKHAPLTNVLERVNQLVTEGRYTIAEIARDINIGAPTVSQALAGKYGARTRNVESALLGWLRRVNEPISDDDTAGLVIETENVRQVLSACDHAQSSASMEVIVGDPGFGKTVGLREWTRQARKREHRFVLVTCHVSMTYHALLREIADALQIVVRGASYRVRNAVLERLKSRPTTLLVDEVQHCDLKSLEVLRDLHDQGRVGLVISGSQALYWMLRDGGSKKYRIELEQLQDRLRVRHILARMSKAETSQFAKAWWSGEVALDVLGRLYTHADGNPRRLVRLLEHAREMCEDAGEETLTSEIVDAAGARIWKREGVARG